MLEFIKNKISDTNPMRLFYHKCMAILANIVYGFPSRKLYVIGVTGTKGKTTTTNLITNVLMEAGYKVGMTSTILFQVGDLRWSNATKITTLGPFFLQKMLRRMLEDGCTHAVIEVSSHSLLQNRVWGVSFDTAVFTNIGEDHLDYHGGFENYLRAKGLLFSGLVRGVRKPRIQKIAVLNQDDVNFSYFDQFLADKKYTFGMNGGICYASNIVPSAKGSTFTLNVPNNKLDIKLDLPGAFNVYNALAAATVGMSNNISLNVIKAALEKAMVVPGRYEAVECGQDYNIVVDYAHTEPSLTNLLQIYKPLTAGKLIVVFGCTGGGRDVAKRPRMGESAHKYADYVIVSNDDPYSDNEWQIIEQISVGIKREQGKNFWKLPNRIEAVKLALYMAKKGDTVILAGKGAEEIQMLPEGPVPWDDRKIVRELLSQASQVEL